MIPPLLYTSQLFSLSFAALFIDRLDRPRSDKFWLFGDAFWILSYSWRINGVQLLLLIIVIVLLFGGGGYGSVIWRRCWPLRGYTDHLYYCFALGGYDESFIAFCFYGQVPLGLWPKTLESGVLRLG
jgi:hypothetical protein